VAGNRGRRAGDDAVPPLGTIVLLFAALEVGLV
jgi:hypothetical protein